MYFLSCSLVSGCGQDIRRARQGVPWRPLPPHEPQLQPLFRRAQSDPDRQRHSPVGQPASLLLDLRALPPALPPQGVADPARPGDHPGGAAADPGPEVALLKLDEHHGHDDGRRGPRLAHRQPDQDRVRERLRASRQRRERTPPGMTVLEGGVAGHAPPMPGTDICFVRR